MYTILSISTYKRLFFASGTYCYSHTQLVSV